MKALVVAQNSKLSQTLYQSQNQLPSKMVWKDTNEPVKFPIPVNCERERIWVKGEVFWSVKFADLCQQYPDNYREVSSCPWGTSLWVSDENGYPKMHASNWDSSG